jgi:hypothetical protein
VDHRTAFEGIIRLQDGLSLWTLGPVGYLLHAGLGCAAALFKAAVPPVRTRDRPATRGSYLLWLPIYLTAFTFAPADNLRIYLNELAGPLLVLIAFHRGFRPAFGLLLGYLPLVFVRFSAGAFNYGAGVSGIELLLLIAAMATAAQFRVRPPARLGAKSMLYAAMLVAAVLLDIDYRWSRTITLVGYPFSLGLVFAAGFLFGSRRGFGFGFVWGLAVSVIGVYLSDGLAFGGEWWFARMAAPLVGYWAGRLGVAGTGPAPGSAVRLFGGLYAFRLYLKLLAGAATLPAYLQVPAWWLQSVAAAALLVVLLHRFRVFEPEADETARPAPEQPEELFKPVRKWTWAALTLAGMIALIQYRTDAFVLRIDLFQYIIVFLTGYRYGRMPGLFCGLLVFLPNLVLPLIFGAAQHRLLFSRIELHPEQIRAFGVLGYLLFASAGYFAAVLKARLRDWRISTASAVDIGLTGVKVVPGLAGAVLLIYVTGFSISLTETLRISPNALFFPILLGVAFYSGFKKALTAFWIYLPLALFATSLGFIHIGIGMQGNQVLALFAGLAIAAGFGSRLPPDPGPVRRLSRASFLILAPLALFSAFDINLSGFLPLGGYAFAYGLLFAAGHHYGAPKGFKLGIIWGILACIVRYDITRYVGFGGMWWFPLLVAPIVGCIGGLHDRTATALPLGRTLLVFTSVYALEFVVLLMQGTVSYAQLPFFWLQSAIVALVLTARRPGGSHPDGQGETARTRPG